MKTFLLTTIAFLALTITCKAQWGTSTPNVYYNAGNVGIGTSTPADLLTINSGADRKGLTFLSDGNSSAFSDITFDVLTTAGISTGKPLGWFISHRKDGFFSNTTAGESSLEFYTVLKGGGYIAPLCFKSNGDIILASPKSSASGNVAIGTTDPPIGYKLAVNGSAIATSMTVKLYANWPDFVFKPNYQLPPLTEVKTYIDKNHHLQDVPTEEDVAKNGLNLGEMNKVLVQKVEELTLYLIKKDKEDKEKDTRLNSQQEQINQLEQVVDKLNKKNNK